MSTHASPKSLAPPFSPRAVKIVVFTAVVLVYTASLVFMLLAKVGHDHVFGLARKFDPRFEVSIPTWLSSAVLAACGMKLAWIWVSKREAADRFAAHWLGLSVGFFALSVDETAELHELFIGRLSKAVFGSGTVTQLWAIFGLLIVVLVGLVYIRFLLHLPRRDRIAYLTAGALFVGGGAGVELIGGMYVAAGNPENLVYVMMSLVEETLEALGAAFFLVALFDYSATQAATASPHLVAAPAPQSVVGAA